MGMHSFALFAGNAALAIKEKEINENGPLFVKLVGRKSGLFDWLLTIMGVNTTTVFEVYADRIEYSYGSLSGRMTETIPMSKVSNLLCGYLKPVMLFIFAIIALIGGVVAGIMMVKTVFAIAGLILAVVFFVFYHLKKSTLISVIPNSASATLVVFKRSIIENKNISEEDSKKIITIIDNLVTNANK